MCPTSTGVNLYLVVFVFATQMSQDPRVQTLRPDRHRNLRNNTFKCKECKNKTQISRVCWLLDNLMTLYFAGYAAKLFFQELMALNIAPRLMVD